MKTIIIKENVLTDDTLFLSDENKVFKGGYIAVLKYYTFLNAWNDKEHIIKFRSMGRLNSFLSKNYKDVELTNFDFTLNN